MLPRGYVLHIRKCLPAAAPTAPTAPIAPTASTAATATTRCPHRQFVADACTTVRMVTSVSMVTAKISALAQSARASTASAATVSLGQSSSRARPWRNYAPSIWLESRMRKTVTSLCTESLDQRTSGGGLRAGLRGLWSPPGRNGGGPPHIARHVHAAHLK